VNDMRVQQKRRQHRVGTCVSERMNGAPDDALAGMAWAARWITRIVFLQNSRKAPQTKRNGRRRHNVHRQRRAWRASAGNMLA